MESSSDNYSGGKAVGKMNTWIEHDRSYLTTYVKAENAGYYQYEDQVCRNNDHTRFSTESTAVITADGTPETISRCRIPHWDEVPIRAAMQMLNYETGN